MPKPRNKQEGGERASVRTKLQTTAYRTYFAYVGGVFMHGDSQRLRNVPVGSDTVSGLSQGVLSSESAPPRVPLRLINLLSAQCLFHS